VFEEVATVKKKKQVTLDWKPFLDSDVPTMYSRSVSSLSCLLPSLVVIFIDRCKVAILPDILKVSRISLYILVRYLVRKSFFCSLQ